MQHFWISSLLPASAATTPQSRQASFLPIAGNQSPILKKNIKSEKQSHPHAPQQRHTFLLRAALE